MELVRMIRPPDRQLLNVLAAYDRPVAGLVLALREIVLEEGPDAVERMYSNHHIKFRNESDVERPFVRRYMRSAKD